jgi:hypothetical protein
MYRCRILVKKLLYKTGKTFSVSTSLVGASLNTTILVG